LGEGDDPGFVDVAALQAAPDRSVIVETDDDAVDVAVGIFIFYFSSISKEHIE
jgi:hypothetical protein